VFFSVKGKALGLGYLLRTERQFSLNEICDYDYVGSVKWFEYKVDLIKFNNKTIAPFGIISVGFKVMYH
jgi:hypothetical protein